ncbi:MAG: GGDEF domain-containing protein [Proteobacteria bacterium]|nr:GGDEF domain-containing protein [Pseudomonadota bacterium]
MDSLRNWLANSGSTTGKVARRCAAFALAALIFLPAPALADDAPVRAQAVTAATRLCVQADAVLQLLPRIAWQLGGRRGRIDAEFALAMFHASLSVDDLADRYWQAMNRDARAAGDDQAHGIALIARIQTVLAKGDYAGGRALADELMQLAQASGNEELRADAEEYQGVFDRRRGNLDAALAHQSAALALRRKLGDTAGEATALTNLGTIARDQGDFARCLDYFLQALEIRERIDLRLDVAYRNVAMLYRELDDTQTTQRYFAKAVEAASRYAQPGYYASVQGAYAGFLNDAGNHAAALAAASEALAISEALDNRPSIGFEHLEAGRALLGLRRPDAAAPHFDAALAIGREIGQRELVARSELALAEIALAHNDLARAHGLLGEVSPLLNAAGLRPYLAQAYALRDHLAEAENDPATAHEFAHRHAGLHEELLGTRSSRLLTAIEVRQVREQSRQQLELARRTNELQAERLQLGSKERRYGIVAIAALVAILAVFAALLVRLRKLNRALAEHGEEVDRQRTALADANRRLESQARSLYQATIIDPLTGVHSRSYMLGELGSLLADCRRTQRNLTLLLIDFDNFKQVNDRYGHLAGDRVLVKAVRFIRDALEADCLLGRFGGEEFMVAFVGRDESASRRLAERIRRAVAENMAGVDPPATISIGAAMLRQMPTIDAIDLLIDAADRALYAAKQAGRNQVQGFPARLTSPAADLR